MTSNFVETFDPPMIAANGDEKSFNALDKASTSLCTKKPAHELGATLIAP